MPDALRYVAVEISGGAACIAIPRGSSRVADLPPEPFDGVVVANELLDNLPFRLAVFDEAGARRSSTSVPTASSNT